MISNLCTEEIMFIGNFVPPLLRDLIIHFLFELVLAFDVDLKNVDLLFNVVFHRLYLVVQLAHSLVTEVLRDPVRHNLTVHSFLEFVVRPVVYNIYFIFIIIREIVNLALVLIQDYLIQMFLFLGLFIQAQVFSGLLHRVERFWDFDALLRLVNFIVL